MVYCFSLGEMSERFKELVLKTSDPKRAVGSNPTLSATYLDKDIFIRPWRSTQVGRRGAPAKGVGRETGARVQIPPSPPRKSRLKRRLFRFFEWIVATKFCKSELFCNLYVYICKAVLK